MYKEATIFKQMNQLGRERTPFLFMIDFLKTEGMVVPLDELSHQIQYQIGGETPAFDREVVLKKQPIDLEAYKQQFNLAQLEFRKQTASLINLTCATPIEINLNLEEIYKYAHAKYKLYWKDHFVSFSPETFVKIKDGKIYSFPMKGTIDASIENAAEKILANEKEENEHRNTVNLIRQELEKVSKNVTVNRFRYIDEVQTHDQKLLQVSSEVCGELGTDFHEKLGDLFNDLLPGGSICGVPKEQALQIIEEVETYDRGFYTGVWGVFDGESVDSGVLIRFIEQSQNGLVYKSGGGITIQSEAEAEYQEMLNKVYVPIY